MAFCTNKEKPLKNQGLFSMTRNGLEPSTFWLSLLRMQKWYNLCLILFNFMTYTYLLIDSVMFNYVK